MIETKDRFNLLADLKAFLQNSNAKAKLIKHIGLTKLRLTAISGEGKEEIYEKKELTIDKILFFQMVKISKYFQIKEIN